MRQNLGQLGGFICALLAYNLMNWNGIRFLLKVFIAINLEKIKIKKLQKKLTKNSQVQNYIF
jgi:hypothetical protein